MVFLAVVSDELTIIVKNFLNVYVDLDALFTGVLNGSAKEVYLSNLRLDSFW